MWSGWLGLAVGCSGAARYQAQIETAADLVPGSAVSIRGVEVGSVDKVSVADGYVSVHFRVDGAHEVVLYHDACARVSAPDGVATLVIKPGSSGTLDGPVHGCGLQRWFR